MPRLGHLWLGTITGSRPTNETDDPIVLIVSGRPRDSADKVHFTFPDTSQSDLERGQANIYEVPASGIISGQIDTEELSTESFRLGIRGDNQWVPSAAFVWGREQRDQGQVIPLALAADLQASVPPGVLNHVALSTDPAEGLTSFRIPTVQPGGPRMPINTLIIAMTTADSDDAGTNDALRIRIVTPDGRAVVDHNMTDTFQDDQERGQANIYFVPVNQTFSHSELGDQSIELSILGSDMWVPASFFIFGLAEPIPEVPPFPLLVEPLVQEATWQLGPMSTDPSEGTFSVILPLLPIL